MADLMTRAELYDLYLAGSIRNPDDIVSVTGRGIRNAKDIFASFPKPYCRDYSSHPNAHKLDKNLLTRAKAAQDIILSQHGVIPPCDGDCPDCPFSINNIINNYVAHNNPVNLTGNSDIAHNVNSRNGYVNTGDSGSANNNYNNNNNPAESNPLLDIPTTVPVPETRVREGGACEDGIAGVVSPIGAGYYPAGDPATAMRARIIQAANDTLAKAEVWAARPAKDVGASTLRDLANTIALLTSTLDKLSGNDPAQRRVKLDEAKANAQTGQVTVVMSIEHGSPPDSSRDSSP